MTEIKGVECSHKDCQERCWDDDPDRPAWLDVTMTSEGYDFAETAVLCPNHGRGFVGKMMFHGPVNTGQERVLAADNELNMDPAAEARAATDMAEKMARALDTANNADLVKAGLDLPRGDWDPATAMNPLLVAPTPTTPIPIEGDPTQPIAKVTKNGGSRRGAIRSGPTGTRVKGNAVARSSLIVVMIAVGLFARMRGLG